QVDGDRPALVTDRVHVAADDLQIAADVDEPIELRAAGRRADRQLPDRLAGVQAIRADAPVVEARDDGLSRDLGPRVAAHDQRRLALLDGPQLAAVRDREASEPTVRRAQRDDAPADRRRSEHL